MNVLKAIRQAQKKGHKNICEIDKCKYCNLYNFSISETCSKKNGWDIIPTTCGKVLVICQKN